MSNKSNQNSALHKPLDAITADDASLKAALQEAHTPSLINAMVHITGDKQLIRGDIKPLSGFFADPQAGVSEEHQEEMRALAFSVLKDLRDGKLGTPEVPTGDTIHEMINFLIGKPIAENYVEFLTSELGLSGTAPYAAPEILEMDATMKQGFKVAIIGSGMSGILSAIRLQEAGIEFQIIERHAEAGGTWHQNTYPGCRVDSPNHMYSYSFRPKDWPQYYSRQPVLKEYFTETAQDFNLGAHTLFNTEVLSAAYDDNSNDWELELENTSDGKHSIRVNAIISSVGQLNRPKWPDIPGQSDFKGISFHSTQWEHEHDLKGKRIIVIGTGASTFQLAPEIAKEAEHVSIFQRTAHWVAPVPNYHADIPEGEHWLLNHVPFYGSWYRFSIFWNNAEGILDAARVDETWPQSEVSISAQNDELRQLFIENLKELCGNDTVLLEKLIPAYPPAAKRILFDNGNWVRALRSDNVDLVCDPIAKITADGLVTESGKHYKADVIVYGTGFHASRFLWPMKITGKNALDLQGHWNDDPRAYYGISIPGFPNLFCTYGPNTNIVVNGSIIFFSECEVRYIMGCIYLLLEGKHAALDCKADIHDTFNERIDAGNKQMAWGASNVSSWYKNEKGRVTQNWPFTLREFWEETKRPAASDYNFLD